MPKVELTEDEKKDPFKDLFVGSDQAEKLRREYEEALKKEKDRKGLTKKFYKRITKGRGAEYWLVKKQGIMVTYICPVSYASAKLFAKSWLNDVANATRAKLKNGVIQCE